MYEPPKVAETIKTIAKLKDIQLKNMFSNLGLNKNTLSNMYNGSMLKGDSLAKIADYLGCSVDYLLGRIDCPNMLQHDRDVNNTNNDISLEGDFFKNNRMKFLRTRDNKTFEEIEEQTGIGIIDLTLYEQNKKQPDFLHLQKLAKYFHVSVAYLAGQSEIENDSEDIAQNPNTAYVMTKGSGKTNIIEVSNEEKEIIEQILSAIRKKEK